MDSTQCGLRVPRVESVLSESWPLTQVIPLAVVLATPFGVGAYYGLRAVRLGDAKGWVGLALHVVFMLTALVMPIIETLD